MAHSKFLSNIPFITTQISIATPPFIYRSYRVLRHQKPLDKGNKSEIRNH